MICAAVLVAIMVSPVYTTAQPVYASLSTSHRWADLPPAEVKIYRTLKEVTEGKPSQAKQVSIGIRPMEWGLLYHQLLTDKAEKKATGKVYGFSLDSLLYINPRAPKTGKCCYFFQAERIGKYLHFAVVDRIYFQNGASGPPAEVNWLSDKLVDVNTGKVMTLNRKTFRKLAADRPELVAQFNLEKQKSIKLVPYLKKYFESR